MLLIPNAHPDSATALVRFTRRSWQEFFAGKNSVTAQTQLRLYSEQQRAFGISDICTGGGGGHVCLNLDFRQNFP